MSMTNEQIFEKVKATLADSLNADAEDITPEATLAGDLGAESIDFLDIVFRLERGFNTKIPRDELFPEAIFQQDPKFVKDGVITADGLKELKTRLPFANVDKFAQNPQVKNIGDLFTVDMICKYIEHKMKNS
ncbi:MAG: acyl carrier protein [Gemmatales bacterium]